MFLAVDVGNSNTCLGVFDEDGRMVCELRLGTDRAWTRDSAAVAFSQALSLHTIALRQVDACAVACVVPPVLSPVVEALQTFAGVRPLVVGPGVKTGMPIRYEPAQDVGADRIVASVAAHQRWGHDSDGEARAVVVVDFGTATTFDVISAKPEYLGGAISPGVGISADALFSRASRLPRVEILRPERVVGRNTVAAMQSGLLFGYVGLVEGMLARIKAELGVPAFVVATGGFAPMVAAESTSIDVVDGVLVLEGLRCLWQRNCVGGA